MTEAIRLTCYLAFKHLNSVSDYTTVFVGNHDNRRVLKENGFSWVDLCDVILKSEVDGMILGYSLCCVQVGSITKKYCCPSYGKMKEQR